jgi:hypothetical protein
MFSATLFTVRSPNITLRHEIFIRVYSRPFAVRFYLRVNSRAFAVCFLGLLDGVTAVDHQVFAVDHRGGVAG